MLNLLDDLKDFFKPISRFYYFFNPKLFATGYNQNKIFWIKKVIEGKEYKKKQYIDERLIEIPWIIKKIKRYKGKNILDAGCTLNHNYLIKKILIYFENLYFANIYEEKFIYKSNNVHYVKSDISKKIKYSKNFFDIVTCISVLEHIGFDNSLYNNKNEKSKEPKGNKLYLKAIKELIRVTKKGGSILLTIPFGKKFNFKNYQQFNVNDLKSIQKKFKKNKLIISYYKFSNGSWRKTRLSNCNTVEPIYKDNFGVSSNSVAFIEVIKR